MREIEKYFFNILSKDYLMNELLGVIPTDPRIYEWNPTLRVTYNEINVDTNGNTIFVNNQLKAALFFDDSQARRPPLHVEWFQEGDIYFYFQVVSPDKDLTKQITEHINDLLRAFDEIGFKTEHYYIGKFELNNAIDGHAEGTPKLPLYTRTVSYHLYKIFKLNVQRRPVYIDAILY